MDDNTPVVVTVESKKDVEGKAKEQTWMSRWKRLFTRTKKEKKVVVLSETATRAEKAGENHARKATTSPRVEMLPMAEETVPALLDEEEIPLAKPPAGAIPANPVFRLEDLRVLIRNELAQTQVVVSPTKQPGGGLVLRAILLGLLLVAAVGVAGLFLPRPAESDARILVEMASLYQAAGKPEDANRVLDEVVTAGISDPETLGQVGEIYRLLYQYDKAITILSRAVAQEPTSEIFHLGLARSFAGAGKQKEAISQYQMLIGINPTDFSYFEEMGHSYLNLKNYNQALAQYQKTLEIDPKYWQGYYYQGEVYRKWQRYDQAIAQYQKSLEINPNIYATHLWLGVSYMGKHDSLHAIEHYQAAMDIDPKQDYAYYYLGEAYLGQGHFKQALEPYQQAIEMNDRYTEAYIGLGKAYLVLGDCDSAILKFAQALRLDPSNTEIQEGLEECTREE